MPASSLIPMLPPAGTPSPAATPVTGWPTVNRGDVTMTGSILHEDTRYGRLRLAITLTGLAPGEPVALVGEADHRVKWVCGVEPEPCGDIGCGPAASEVSVGVSTASTAGTATGDGTARLMVELEAQPPSAPCPGDPEAPWRAMVGRWMGIAVSSPDRGLILRPEPVERGETY